MGWVTERSKCTLEIAFDDIRDCVETDLTEAKKLIPEGHRSSSFNIQTGNNHGIIKRFYVTAFPIGGDCNRDERTIKFESYKDRIFVDRSGGPKTLPDLSNIEIRQKWDFSTSSCVLCVGGERKSAEEISQLAMEPVFFEHSR